MTHFTVLVIGDNIETQLAKYDENIQMPPRVNEEVSNEDKTRFMKYYQKTGFVGTFEECYKEHGEDWNYGNWVKNSKGIWEEWSTYNPDSKWDWYQIGGRWSGFFKLKKNCNGDIGESGVFGNTPKKGYVDSAFKKDIDFKGMRRLAKGQAMKDYDSVASIFGGEIPKLKYTWRQIVDEQGENFDRDKAKAKYDTQPEIVTLNDIRENGTKKQKKIMSGFYFSLDDYNCTRDEYINKAGRGSTSTYAILIDGKWFEKGNIGWWGMSSNEMNKDDWDKKVTELIDGTNDDVMFSLVDCHI